MKQERILLIGPWVGEFGWELHAWQGHVRTLSKQFDKTKIIGRPGNAFLYADITDEYYEFDVPYDNSDSWNGTFDRKALDILKAEIDHTHYVPGFHIGFDTREIRNGPLFDSQQFIQYQSDTLDIKYDIIIHARNRNLVSSRNWGIDKWNEISNRLISDNFTIASIGRESDSFHVANTIDHRGINLEDLVSLYNNTNLLVGSASGPLHLGSLCNTNIMTWGFNQSKKRFEKLWNPLNAECNFLLVNDWNPSVDEIYKSIISSLKK